MDRKLLAGLGLYRLGIDFGTSSTVAMTAGLDGRARPLLFDGTPLLPSAVCGRPAGGLLVGGDAVEAAATYPERFEPYPKRRIDDTVVLFGETDVAVVDMIGAVLRRVADEAGRATGGPPAEVVLTHPASWTVPRREALLAAAARAGIAKARLLAEPVAAGHYFRTAFGRVMPPGGHLLVYDLGAGRFDASVLRRAPYGFVVLASEGLADAGGLAVDAAVMAHLAASYSARDPRAWARLSAPATPADRRLSRQAWDAVRAAKEILSGVSSTRVCLPALDQDAPLSRDQLDALARPILDRTVDAARRALLDARVPAASLTAILLAGGATRMPLVEMLLHDAFGIAPTTIDQPELVVACGSACG